MKILLLGPGKIGGAWLNKLVTTKIYQNITDITVVQPSMSKKLSYKDYKKVSFISSITELTKDYTPEIVIIAIKPQMFDNVLSPIKNFLSKSLILSVAAGKPLEVINKYTGANNRIIRIMPNIGINIGKSVNLLYADANLAVEDRSLAELLLQPTGNQYWLSSEAEIDQLTPITGCGPAFYYLLSAELVRIMVEDGFNRDMITKLVSETLDASALYAKECANYQDLITDVASKGGATQAALDSMDESMKKMISDAYKAAMRRINQLL